MRKIDKKQFIDYTYKDNGFSVTMADFKSVLNLFNNRAHGTITGRKIDGGTAIIDQK